MSVTIPSVTIPTSWPATGNYTIAPSNGTWTTTAIGTDLTPKGIHVQGDAVFHGNITWQGRDMREWFEAVESRLGMLQPNPELEKDWEELAKLRQQYVELERDLREKQQVFDILKKNST